MSEEINTAEVYEVDKLTLLNCAEIWRHGFACKKRLYPQSG